MVGLGSVTGWWDWEVGLGGGTGKWDYVVGLRSGTGWWDCKVGLCNTIDRLLVAMFSLLWFGTD